MMDENRLDNIVECSYNMDNGYVEVWYVDGNMLQIKCEEVEAALRTTEQSLAKLHKLLDNKPIEYVAMVLSGGMQAYCDIEDEMVIMTDEGRKTFLSAWQSKKQEVIKHPFLDEKIEWGMVPHVQSMLLERYLRGDLDEYPPFFWK